MPPPRMQRAEMKAWGSHLVQSHTDNTYYCTMCKLTAVGATAIRAFAKKPCLGTRGAKPWKRSPDNHLIWNEAQIT
eukprot:11016768-Heterocapsa_arctica.AAC.1